MQVKKQQLELNMEQQTGPNWERSTSRLCAVTLFTWLTCRVHHVKRWAGGLTSWNQDCQEKYQQPQICRWYHSYGRKWRGTKEPLDVVEKGEWKSWLKAKYSKNEDQGIWSYHFIASRWGKSGNSVRFHLLGLQNQCRWWVQPQN